MPDHAQPLGLVGMVHLEALPGTPSNHLPPDAIIQRAVEDASVLAKAGFDAILVENMLDAPYMMRSVGPEIVATMTASTTAVRAAIDLPVGVQVLAGANSAAMSIAHASGCSFIRAEGFAYAAVADEGLFAEADAGPLLRHRRMLGADTVSIWADVQKKHSSHAITSDLSLAEIVAGTAFCGADAVVVTGSSTGAATKREDIEEAAAASNLPVIVGSGATPESIPELLQVANAVIIGSAIKIDGDWRRPVDPERAARAVEARNHVR